MNYVSDIVLNCLMSLITFSVVPWSLLKEIIFPVRQHDLIKYE